MKVIVVEYFVEYNLRCRLSNEIFLNREPIVKDFLKEEKGSFCRSMTLFFLPFLFLNMNNSIRLKIITF